MEYKKWLMNILRVIELYCGVIESDCVGHLSDMVRGTTLPSLRDSFISKSAWSFSHVRFVNKPYSLPDVAKAVVPFSYGKVATSGTDSEGRLVIRAILKLFALFMEEQLSTTPDNQVYIVRSSKVYT